VTPQQKAEEGAVSYEIEKGIEVPERGNIKYPFARMVAGDSFVVPAQDHHGVRASARNFCLRHRPDMWFKVRAEGDKFRVWLILKEDGK
jgi:hypothetical protein